MRTNIKWSAACRRTSDHRAAVVARRELRETYTGQKLWDDKHTVPVPIYLEHAREVLIAKLCKSEAR